jgi:chromosome partitioning protein
MIQKKRSKTGFENLEAIPSIIIQLAGAEVELVSAFKREYKLKDAISIRSKDEYDYIIIDCPPALGLLDDQCANCSR